MKFQSLCSYCAVALIASMAQFANADWTESFEDGQAGTRWSSVIGASDGEADDATVNYAFDYSAITTNPNGSGENIGAFLQSNVTDVASTSSSIEASSIVIYPQNETIAGPFILTADIYLYYQSGSGSTEHGLVGVLDPLNPIAPHRYSSEVGSLGWGYASDNGAGDRGLHSYDENGFGPNPTVPTDTLGDYDDVPAGYIPGFETGVTSAGGPGSNTWVEVKVIYDGSTFDFYLNGSLIDSYDDTSDLYSDGAIYLGTTDLYSSVNSTSGAIIDNVAFAQVPEPSSLAVLIASVVGLVVWRRS